MLLADWPGQQPPVDGIDTPITFLFIIEHGSLKPLLSSQLSLCVSRRSILLYPFPNLLLEHLFQQRKKNTMEAVLIKVALAILAHSRIRACAVGELALNYYNVPRAIHVSYLQRPQGAAYGLISNDSRTSRYASLMTRSPKLPSFFALRVCLSHLH